MECFRRHRRRRSGETCYTLVCIIHYGYIRLQVDIYTCVYVHAERATHATVYCVTEITFVSADMQLAIY